MVAAALGCVPNCPSYCLCHMFMWCALGLNSLVTLQVFAKCWHPSLCFSLLHLRPLTALRHHPPPPLSSLCRSLLHATSVLQTASTSHAHICHYIVTANQFSVLVDVLVPLLTRHSEAELCTALLTLLASVLSTSTLSLSTHPPSLPPALTDCVR